MTQDSVGAFFFGVVVGWICCLVAARIQARGFSITRCTAFILSIGGAAIGVGYAVTPGIYGASCAAAGILVGAIGFIGLHKYLERAEDRTAP